jgi:hypothetical protein
MDTGKRKFIRHPFNYPIKTKIIHPEYRDGDIISESKNISAGGLLFTCKNKISTGVEVEIDLQVEKRRLLVRGQVVRCRKTTDGRYDVAVEFDTPNEILKVRMMEQVVRIELFKNRVERMYNVKLDFAWVAKAWIRRYSKAFASHYDV